MVSGCEFDWWAGGLVFCEKSIYNNNTFYQRFMAQKSKKKNISNGKAKPKVKGKGNYAAGMATSMLASELAGAVKSELKKRLPPGTFERAGGNMGARLGRGLANITGVGDYVLNDTFTTGKLKKGMEPQVISNVEYAFDLKSYGTADFYQARQLCHPSNPYLFPWLAQLATLYTKYRFKQLIFEFRSSSSDYAVGAALGTVIMAPQYNQELDAFTTKQQMEAATHAVSSKPSNSMMCGLECAPKNQNLDWYYVRNDNTEVPTQFTDWAWFNWAVAGSAAPVNATLGEVWVHYTVELSEPVLASSVSSYSRGVSHAFYSVSNTTTGATANTFGLYSSTPAQRVDGTYAPTALVGGLGRQITWSVGKPSGKYFVGVDTGTANRWWFKSPGVYYMRFRILYTTPPTTVPDTIDPGFVGDNGDCYLVGTVNGEYYDWNVSGNSIDRKVVDFTAIIQVMTIDSSALITMNNNVSGIATSIASRTDVDVWQVASW